MTLEKGKQLSVSWSPSANAASFWLVAWTLNNVGVTLLNKAAFATVDFRYPYCLSAIHMCCNFLGSQWVFYSMSGSTITTTSTGTPSSLASTSATSSHTDDASSKTVPLYWVSHLLGNHGHVIIRKQLDAHGKQLIFAFSLLFSLNIAIGNVSLQHVSVNFNQVMRSLVPVITIALEQGLFQKQISRTRQYAVIPVIIGVGLACFGDMSYTILGLCYTMFCVVLAALKVVASGQLLTGNVQLHPVDLLAHMAPLAMVQCILLSYWSGELHEIAARWHELSPFQDLYPSIVVWMSGFLSFTLNISSLQANKLTSPLTLCIAANVKQVLMIVLSTLLFHVQVTPLNGAGIVIVLLGSARYSFVSLNEQQEKKRMVNVASNKDDEEQQVLDELEEEDGLEQSSTTAAIESQVSTSEMVPLTTTTTTTAAHHKRRGNIVPV